MDADVKKPGKVKGDDAILEEARDRFKLAKDADAKNRADGLDDLEFADSGRRAVVVGSEGGACQSAVSV